MEVKQAMAKKKKSMYDFNSILRGLNIFLCLLSIYLHASKGDNEYTNQTTIVLGVLLGLENIGMLIYEKKTNNPFLIILVFLITIFYLLRVCTLISVPFSETFSRDSITVGDLNYALIFIILSNAAMFFGFYLSRAGKSVRPVLPESPYSKKHLRNLMIILMITIFLVFLSSKGISGGTLIVFLETVFFHQEVIILFTFSFILYHFDKIPPKIRLFVSLLTVAFIIFVTLAGSRSAMLTAGYLILMSILVVKKRVMISKWVFFSVIIMIPVSVVFFIISTFNRDLETKETSVVKIVQLMREDDIFEDEKINFFLGRMYQRIGFLDYSTDLIAKPKIFKSAINPVYYTYSIIDNILTPGFDIFNTAKATNVIGMLANGHPVPTKKQAEKSYQSDMMGIYGEYYVMFYGYPALLVYFLFAFMIQRIYDTIKTKDQLQAYFYQTFCISVFFTWMNSFGTDWIMNEAVSLIFTGMFIHRYYHSPARKIKLNTALT